jgi:DNA-binding CsgD family transcriptional regulator
MKPKVSLNHPTFSLASEVSRYASEFMRLHGLAYFQYLRCYADGSISILLNRTDAFKTFLEEKEFPIQSSCEESHEIRPSYLFFWDEELPTRPVNLVREKHGLYHGMTLTKRHKTFYDMVGFAMGSPRSNAASYYVNHLRNFEAFTESFRLQRADLFGIHDREKIALPQDKQDPNCPKMLLPAETKRYSIAGKRGPSYITSQELFCFQLLSQGQSYKEVSAQLSISVKTIETYFNRVKVRTGLQSKEKLFEVLPFVGE